MQNRQETYYLTILGPGCGERVIASVTTANRKIAENLFACGNRNDKDFMLNGLYSEEKKLGFLTELSYSKIIVLVIIVILFEVVDLLVQALQ